MKNKYNIPTINLNNYSNLHKHWESTEKVNYNFILKNINDCIKPMDYITYIRFVNDMKYGIALNKSNNVHEK